MVTRIVVSVVLAPLFFVILFFLPPVYLAVLMAAICALASYELLRATGVAPHNGLYGFTAAAAAAISSSAAAWAQGRPYSGNNASSRFRMAIGHAKTFSTPPKGAFALEDLLEKIKMYILSTKKRKQVSPMVRK